MRDHALGEGLTSRAGAISCCSLDSHRRRVWEPDCRDPRRPRRRETDQVANLGHGRAGEVYPSSLGGLKTEDRLVGSASKLTRPAPTPKPSVPHVHPQQESFRAITRSYYRGAGGALLVFSLTSHQSFSNCQGWLADLRAWGEEDLLVLLVGNKGDVTEEATGGEKREVDREEADKWAQEEGLAGYVETSAKSGAGVEEVRLACIQRDSERERERRLTGWYACRPSTL